MNEGTTAERPSPREYDDYRDYLQAMVGYLRATRRGFSYRWFARETGYSSPSFLKRVIEGERNLSNESMRRFAGALKLSDAETDEFEALVLLTQSKTDAERNRYYARLRRRARKSAEAVQLEKAQYDVYSLWYAFPIHEMMRLREFREDPEWIAAQMQPPIKPSEAKKALELLQKVGLAVRDGEGRLRPAHSDVATPPTVRSLAVRNYHREMLRLASESLDALPTDSRNITSVTVALSPSQYEEMCRRIAHFREEMLDLAGQTVPEDETKDIYILGFPLVPLTQGGKKR